MSTFLAVLGGYPPLPEDAESELARYKAALEMIARHPCFASDKERPDWHCGECASCVAQDALKGED